MEKDILYLEDWKVTKERIKHFDDIIIKIRIQGIPIAGALLSVGALLTPILKTYEFPLFGNAAPLIFIVVSIYVTALIGIDWIHYKLLLESVNHAIFIENISQFKGILQITTILTKNWITRLHLIVALFLYLPILGLSIVISYLLSGQPVS